MSAVGFELLISSICFNATYCDAFYDNNLYDGKLSKKANRTQYLANELNGKHLRIGTVDSYPLSWTERQKDGSLVGRGVAFTLVEILQERYNFTFEVMLPAKNWEGGGDRLESSLLGLVNQSAVDFAAAFLPILTDSQKVVQFSPGLDEGTWTMLLRRPTESAAGSGLLAPFQQDVWYLILVAVLAYGPCITLLTRLWTRLVTSDEDKPIKISPSFWFVYSAFIKQGTTLAPEANTTRVLFATWWIFIILLSAFYTANLTAFLTLSKFTLEIEDPKDLYKKNYKWLAKEGTAVEYVVTDPDEDLYYLNKMVVSGRGIFREKQDAAAYLPSVRAGAVLVHDQPAVDHLLYDDYQRKARQGVEEKDRCTYVVTSNHFMRKMRAFAYPRNSSLPAIFDTVLRSLVEAGMIKFLIHQKLPSTKICPLDLQSKERRLRNSDLMMTYIITMVGIAAAISVFIGEMFLKRRFAVKVKIGGRGKAKVSDSTNQFTLDDSRPPPYDTLFGKNSRYRLGKRRVVNGRDYWVTSTVTGDTRLIPMRTPSALLYQ